VFRIGIVGLGYVGIGMLRFFEDMVTAVYDPFITPENAEEVRGLGYAKGFDDKRAFGYLDLAIVSVPTNTAKDGESCDASIVEESVKWLTEINPHLLILVKSAVVPNEIERIKDQYKARLVISPEYLGEGKYFVPFWKYPDPVHMKYHTFQIFGGDKKDTSECVDIFVKKGGPNVNFYQADLKTVALCKYAENVWGAMKVTFCNELYEIAKAFGVDYNELRELWTADSRVEKMHTAVFRKARGFSGKCFPKDLKAIVKASTDAGYEPKLLKQIIERNEYFKSLSK